MAYEFYIPIVFTLVGRGYDEQRELLARLVDPNTRENAELAAELQALSTRILNENYGRSGQAGSDLTYGELVEQARQASERLARMTAVDTAAALTRSAAAFADEPPSIATPDIYDHPLVTEHPQLRGILERSGLDERKIKILLQFMDVSLEYQNPQNQLTPPIAPISPQIIKQLGADDIIVAFARSMLPDLSGVSESDRDGIFAASGRMMHVVTFLASFGLFTEAERVLVETALFHKKYRIGGTLEKLEDVIAEHYALALEGDRQPIPPVDVSGTYPAEWTEWESDLRNEVDGHEDAASLGVVHLPIWRVIPQHRLTVKKPDETLQEKLRRHVSLVILRLRVKGWKTGNRPTDEMLDFALRDLNKGERLPVVTKETGGYVLLADGHHRIAAVQIMVQFGLLPEGTLHRLPFDMYDIGISALAEPVNGKHGGVSDLFRRSWVTLFDFNRIARGYAERMRLSTTLRSVLEGKNIFGDQVAKQKGGEITWTAVEIRGDLITYAIVEDGELKQVDPSRPRGADESMGIVVGRVRRHFDNVRRRPTMRPLIAFWLGPEEQVVFAPTQTEGRYQRVQQRTYDAMHPRTSPVAGGSSLQYANAINEAYPEQSPLRKYLDEETEWKDVSGDMSDEQFRSVARKMVLEVARRPVLSGKVELADFEHTLRLVNWASNHDVNLRQDKDISNAANSIAVRLFKWHFTRASIPIRWTHPRISQAASHNSTLPRDAAVNIWRTHFAQEDFVWFNNIVSNHMLMKLMRGGAKITNNRIFGTVVHDIVEPIFRVAELEPTDQNPTFVVLEKLFWMIGEARKEGFIIPIPDDVWGRVTEIVLGPSATESPPAQTPAPPAHTGAFKKPGPLKMTGDDEDDVPDPLDEEARRSAQQRAYDAMHPRTGPDAVAPPSVVLDWPVAVRLDNLPMPAQVRDVVPPVGPTALQAALAKGDRRTKVAHVAFLDGDTPSPTGFAFKTPPIIDEAIHIRQENFWHYDASNGETSTFFSPETGEVYKVFRSGWKTMTQELFWGGVLHAMNVAPEIEFVSEQFHLDKPKKEGEGRDREGPLTGYKVRSAKNDEWYFLSFHEWNQVYDFSEFDLDALLDLRSNIKLLYGLLHASGIYQFDGVQVAMHKKTHRLRFYDYGSFRIFDRKRFVAAQGRGFKPIGGMASLESGDIIPVHEKALQIFLARLDARIEKLLIETGRFPRLSLPDDGLPTPVEGSPVAGPGGVGPAVRRKPRSDRFLPVSQEELLGSGVDAEEVWRLQGEALAKGHRVLGSGSLGVKGGVTGSKGQPVTSHESLVTSHKSLGGRSQSQRVTGSKGHRVGGRQSMVGTLLAAPGQSRVGAAREPPVQNLPSLRAKRSNPDAITRSLRPSGARNDKKVVAQWLAKIKDPVLKAKVREAFESGIDIEDFKRKGIKVFGRSSELQQLLRQVPAEEREEFLVYIGMQWLVYESISIKAVAQQFGIESSGHPVIQPHSHQVGAAAAAVARPLVPVR